MNGTAKNHKMVALALALLVPGFVGCGDMELDKLVNSEDQPEEVTEYALVTPEFAVRGLDEVPEELMLQQLGLSVAEIRLEPLRGDEGFVYATSRPFSLTFDLESGEEVLRGETVKFPEAGRFLVSIRLEPPDEDKQLEIDDPLYAGSLGLRGMVRSNFLASDEGQRELSDDEEDGKENDGNPLPLPAERINDDEEMWTAFTLRSDRVVAYTYSDVELVPGEQALTFSFDVQDWARDAAAPIIDAAESHDSDAEVIDLGGVMDSPTSEPEALLGTGSVSTKLY